jgi:hypothetical protein
MLSFEIALCIYIHTYFRLRSLFALHTCFYILSFEITLITKKNKINVDLEYKLLYTQNAIIDYL